MKFNLYLLADHLKEYRPHFPVRCPMDLTLKDILYMDRNAQCREDAVYILKASKLALLNRQDGNASLSFMIVCPEESVIEEGQFAGFPKPWNILMLRTDQPLKAVYQEAIHAMSMLNNWYEDLTEAVLCQDGLQRQLDEAARFLKNPIALFDMSMSLLGWAGSMPEHIQDPVWENVLSQGYNTLETFPAHTRRQVFDSVGEDRVVIAPPMLQKGVSHNMVATLYHKGLPFACIAMNELNVPFDDAEYSYMLVIKKQLERSPVLLRNVVLAEDKGSKIFLRLLRGQAVDERQMTMFLREHGWKTGDCMMVYLLRYTQDDKMNENSYRSHIEAIRKIVPDLELFYYEGSLVAVERNHGISESRERLREIGIKLAIPIGASMVYQGYEHLHEAYLQAQAAWRYTSGQATTVRYEEVYSKDMLDTLNTQNSIGRFCHPALLKFDRKEEWERELLHTLYVFLQKGKRISATAEELHIHRNTLLNRLRILEERLGMKSDGLTVQEEHILYISCMIVFGME